MSAKKIKFKIEEEAFHNGKSLVELYKESKEEPMRKINVKIRKSDLRIIESIANLSGTPRSQIINDLVNESICKILKDIASDDFECAALVAAHADRLSCINYRDRGSWSDKLFDSANDRLDYYYSETLQNIPKDGFSEQFRVVNNRLEKIK